MTGRVPLDRALSKLGAASRTEARGLIAAGRVSVDGLPALTATRLVSPERQTITIDGRRAVRQDRRLLAFHKPRGVVTTRRDPQGRKTVFDVLGTAGEGLQPIGRLDQASTGLLLFTNDTRLADQLTDPANAIPRRYVVTVRGRVDPSVAAGLPAHTVEIRKSSGRETHLLVELTQGRNREIRRMFEAVGHDVTRVHRIAFGDHELGDLQPGEWREEHTSSGGKPSVVRRTTSHL